MQLKLVEPLAEILCYVGPFQNLSVRRFLPYDPTAIWCYRILWANGPKISLEPYDHLS